MTGRFIAVVGPSGVGKDSVMDGLCAALPDMVRCRRVITRAAEAGGEAHEAVDEATFRQRAQRGEFILWWQAHGLHYGIARSVENDLNQGRDVLANLSRGKLVEAAEAFPQMAVLAITAAPEILDQRLAARGREDAQDRVKRLERASLTLPEGLPARVAVLQIDNSGALDEAVHAALRALQRASA